MRDERGSAARQSASSTEGEPRDATVNRAQAAGGPLDVATYVCGCGFMFSAPVSTTVSCPHCGGEQAW